MAYPAFTLTTPLGSLDLSSASTDYLILDGSWDFTEPGVIRFIVQLTQDTNAEVMAAYTALQRALNHAAIAETIGTAATFTMQWSASHAAATFDLIGGSLTPMLPYTGATVQNVAVELLCYPYARGAGVTPVIAGTLSGTTAAFLVEDVPGDIDALVHLELTDTSGSGVINRFHIAAAPRDQSYAASSDFTAWLDAAIQGTATSQADVGASMGDAYAQRVSSSTTMGDMAKLTLPTSAKHRGRRDCWIRASGTGTALSAPTGLTNSITAPSTLPVTTSNVISRGQTGSLRATSGTSGTITLSGTTTAGSLIVVFYTKRVTSGSVPTATGYTAGPSTSITSEAGNEIYTGVLFKRAAAAASTISVTYNHTATAGDPVEFYAVELVNGDAILGGVLDSSATDTTQPGSALATLPTTYAGEYALTWVATAGSTTSDLTDFWFAGFEAVGFIGASVIGGRTISYEAGTAAISQAPAVQVTATINAWAALTLNIKPTTTTVTTPVEPYPGALVAGSYAARVQAIDAAGYRSNATSSSTATVTTDLSRVAFSWTGSSGAVAYAVAIQATITGEPVLVYEVITTDVTYTLASLEGLGLISALPSTSGATAPAPWVRARIATAGDSSSYADVPEVVTDGTGTFTLLRLFSDRPVPPVGAMLSEWADSQVIVQSRSANGASSTVKVDAGWVVPSREPQALAYVPGLALATKRRWVLEAHRSGKGVIGWLENTGTGAEAGRVIATGALLLVPGDNIVLLTMEQAAGASVLAASVTVSLTFYPRFRWGWG